MFRERHWRPGGRRHKRRLAHRTQGPLQPWLLLLLLRKPSHGYELLERLSQDEKIADADPGFLYRTLRQLEEDGMVNSSWDMEGTGPARRLYQVTAQGNEYLRSWVDDIRLLQNNLDYFMEEYEAYLGTEESKG